MANTPPLQVATTQSLTPYQQLTSAAGGSGFLASGQFGNFSSADDPQAQQYLKTLQQFDPSASLQQQTSSTDGSTSYGLKFDASKMPMAKAGTEEDYNLDEGNAAQHVAGQASTLNSTAGAKNDPTLGWTVPTSDVGQISDAENQAEQSNGGFLDKAVGAAVPDSPLKFAIELGSMGLGAAASAGLFSGLTNGIDPSILSAIKGGQQAYQAYGLYNGLKNDPEGTATNIALGQLTKYLGS